MYRCLFCGYYNPSETARFCVECGPDGAAKDWTPKDIDHPAKVSQYVSMLSEFYFDAQTEAAVEKFSLRMRERLKISYDTHVSIITKLAAQKKSIVHLANFRIEFNENVTDAYAGHDTYLSFRYTNLSEDDLFKISLLWDDPETTDRIDLRAQTSNFVKPQGTATLGGSVIFERMGIKELVDMQITITDQFSDSANFKAEPFSFRVGNHDQRITQNISTHNQISIEGRGVVDASGMGAEKAPAHSTPNNLPRWRELGFVFVPDVLELKLVANAPTANANAKPGEPKDEKISQAAASTTELEELFNLAMSYANESGFDKDEKKATLLFTEAALKGHALSQSCLGVHYASGIGIEEDLKLASKYLHLSAESGCAHGQHSLGMFYLYVFGTVGNRDLHLARYWLEKAADQGYKLAADELPKLAKLASDSADQIAASSYWSERQKQQEAGNKRIKEMVTPPPHDASCPCGSGLQYKSCHAKLAKRNK